jgi:predicted porin
MKKSLIALAVLGAFSGVAMAQSSVKIDGTVDLGVQSVKNGSASGGEQQVSMINSGINSSQFRVSGVEDLGGGLRASFNLNSGLNANNGTINTLGGTTTGQFWNRRATVSVLGGFGEIRLGRDYTPTFWNQTLFDPFGTNGIGTHLGAVGAANSLLGTNATTAVRANNAVQYWTPALGGLEVQVMLTPNQGAAGATGNKYQGGRVGYSVGPVSLGVSVGQTTVLPASAGDDKLKMTNLAGSYKFGPAKLDLMWAESKNGNFKQVSTQFGGNITMGQGELRFSINKYDNKGTGIDANDADHVSVGWIQNVSTRTAIYGTYSSLKNKGTAKNTIGGFNSAGMLNDETSRGAEVGLRHFF